MGSALVFGINKRSESSRYRVHFYVSASSQSSRQRLQKAFGSGSHHVDLITDNNVEAAHAADIILLAFQPQQLSEVFANKDLRGVVRGKLIISVLAGISTLQMAEVIYQDESMPRNRRLVRAIPTIGAQINESMTLIGETGSNSKDQNLVTWLFEQVGRVQYMSEDLINTVTAIGAACHALAVVATDAIVDASVAEGVSRSMALSVATQCQRSASTLLQHDGSIEPFKESMSIARGITINALLRLDKNQVRSGISDAVRHAVQYAEAMSKEN
jgi:pyrroline-5-carboxylate reductase